MSHVGSVWNNSISNTIPFNGIFSGQPGKAGIIKAEPFWTSMKQEMMGWQWHQLDHMQITCTSFQTDNHTNTPLRNK